MTDDAGLRLRQLRAADAPRLAELECQLFPGDNPWSQSVFAAELDCPSSVYVGLVDADDVMRGYGGLGFRGPATACECEVLTIGVDPDWQRRGAGRRLIEALLSEADAHAAPVFLEVRCDNDPAIALYEAYGFMRVGVRPGYYQPSGADAFTMLRRAAGSEVDCV